MSITLSENEIEQARKLVCEYLQSHPHITNRKLREISGTNYDQAIFFFNRMLEEGTLQRIGEYSGTKYQLP